MLQMIVLIVMFLMSIHLVNKNYNPFKSFAIQLLGRVAALMAIWAVATALLLHL